MRDEILEIIKMEDILNKYNIKVRHSMYSCPFHKDNTPSAKIYGNTFHCFSCGETGDVIQFVQTLFNLSFVEAMQKINQDFNLGLHNNHKVDYNKLKQLKEEREQKELMRKIKQKKYNELCFKLDKYEKTKNFFKSKIDFKNWEDFVYIISKLQDKIEITNMELENIEKELSSR